MTTADDDRGKVERMIDEKSTVCSERKCQVSMKINSKTLRRAESRGEDGQSLRKEHSVTNTTSSYMAFSSHDYYVFFQIVLKLPAFVYFLF